MQRRRFVWTGLLASASAMVAANLFGQRSAAGADGTFKVSMSADEWRRKLTSDQFAVLREAGTERPFTSALLSNHKTGLYRCVGCDTALYASDKKFESGTGWPSFWAPVDGGVGTSTDYKLVYPRTEVHCATCGGHLGHVFDDGPQPTGKRHCINGVILAFKEGPVGS